MVYNIVNRMQYRGFHPIQTGAKTIIKPDGKAARGEWRYGCLAVVPMPVPESGKPQMPILCLHGLERRELRISESSVCPCTLSLFSGTWMDTHWDTVMKTIQRDWLEQGKTSADWKGIPVFEGDVFRHRDSGAYYVVTWDAFQGFQLTPVEPSAEVPAWFFGRMRYVGTIWTPPKEITSARLQRFHKMRNADARVEAIRF